MGFGGSLGSLFLRFQNAADFGKKYQHVATASLTSNVGEGSVFECSDTAISWPSTFGTNPPHCWTTQTASNLSWGGVISSINNTGANVNIFGYVITCTGTITAHGIG